MSKLRRRRWLIAAQGSSVRENPGYLNQKLRPTLKGLFSCRTLSGFKITCDLIPRLSLRSNLGLRLANAFGVFQTSEYLNLTGCIRKTLRGGIRKFSASGRNSTLNVSLRHERVSCVSLRRVPPSPLPGATWLWVPVFLAVPPRSLL